MITHIDEIKESSDLLVVSRQPFFMKILDAFLHSLVMLISSLPLILLILALQEEAAVPLNPPLSQAQIGEIQQLLIDHDPRRLLAGDHQEESLTEAEVNALLVYVKNSNPALEAVSLHVDLLEDAADLALSTPVTLVSITRYFNLVLHFRHGGDTLRLDSVDIGALTIPSALLDPLGRLVKTQLKQDSNYQLVSTFIHSIHVLSIHDERITLAMDWQQDNLETMQDQARQVFVSEREAERLIYYHNQLVETAAGFPEYVRTIGLNDLFRPLFLYASINSAGGADPVAENRAIFIVLSAYLTDWELSRLIGKDVELATPRNLKVVIESRDDLPRHVVSSAAIAASAGAATADVLSVYKEVYDSRYRTGFSFSDIAANQVGAKLGSLSNRSAADALLLQDLMKGSVSETDYMPPVGPHDGITEAEFTELYGSRNSPAYRQRLQGIADSIAMRPFFQTFAAEGRAQ